MTFSLEGKKNREHGFVLVGVVMFVLALTILGLSLFSLSGYEAQSTAQSADAEAAFFAACNGIEHAKFVLAKRESLSSVQNLALCPDSNVVYARARLLTGTLDDTSSAIPNLAPGTAIEIRVLARVGTERRMVQADYVPNQAANLYKRLISVSDSVHVKREWHAPPNDLLYSSMDTPLGSTAGVWQSSSSLDWVPNTLIDPTRVHVSPVPVPDLASYFSSFWPLAKAVSGNPQHHFDLTGGATIPGGPTDIEFFKTSQDPNSDDATYSILAAGGSPRFDLKDNGPPRTTIWLLDHGMRFDTRVTFVSDPGDLLVIVAKPSLRAPENPHDMPAGVWMFAGLDSPNLPIVLVSNAQIILEQFNAPYFGAGTTYLSLFGQSVWLAGCRRDAINHDTTSWLHPANHPFDAPNNLIDRLCELGVLPNSDATGTRFKSVAGTWTELDPDNPPIFN